MSRVDDIRARTEAATRGPWETVPTVGNAVIAPDADGGYWTDIADRIESEPDAEFIAHARDDIPFLLAEVERLEREKAEAWEAGYRARMFGSLNTRNPYKEAP